MGESHKKVFHFFIKGLVFCMYLEEILNVKQPPTKYSEMVVVYEESFAYFFYDLCSCSHTTEFYIILSSSGSLVLGLLALNVKARGREMMKIYGFIFCIMVLSFLMMMLARNLIYKKNI